MFKFKKNIDVVTGANSSFNTGELYFSLLGTLDVYVPVIRGTGDSAGDELGIVCVNDRLAIINFEEIDNVCEIIFAQDDFSNSASLFADFDNNLFKVNWDLVSDSEYNLGTTDFPWNNGIFVGDLYLLSDSSEIFLGANSDMKIMYDGTSGHILVDLQNPSDLHVDCGTDKTLVLDESVWDDVQFPISAGKVPDANYPSFETFTTNTQAFAFSVNDYIDLESEELPHGWKEGTNGSVHLHFANKTAQNSGASRYVKFTVWIAYADANEVYTETSFNMECEIPNGTAALTHFLCVSSTAFNLANNKIGTQMTARVKRIAATGGTEYADDVFITQTGIHVEHDTVGSRQLSTK